MASGQPLDVLVESGFFIFAIQFLDQEIGEAGFIQAAGNRVQRQDGADFRAESEKRSRAMIVKRFNPDVVAGAE